jgi:hypothetical protein
VVYRVYRAMYPPAPRPGPYAYAPTVYGRPYPGQPSYPPPASFAPGAAEPRYDQIYDPARTDAPTAQTSPV